jgi:hypothetical protein
VAFVQNTVTKVVGVFVRFRAPLKLSFSDFKRNKYDSIEKLCQLNTIPIVMQIFH